VTTMPRSFVIFRKALGEETNRMRTKIIVKGLTYDSENKIGGLSFGSKALPFSPCEQEQS